MAAAAVLLNAVALLFLQGGPAAAMWCVTRSDSSEQALQKALDYACGGGADCAPILPSGLCFLPNTVQAHASYAFNSYYQRHRNAPDSCSFGGTSTIAATDPSYGSCVYPSSPSTAGGAAALPGVTTLPMPSTSAPLYGGAGSGPDIPEAPASSGSRISSIVIYLLVFLLIVRIMC